MTIIFRNKTIFWDISKWNRGQKKWNGGSIREMIYVWHRSVCYGLSETSPHQRWYIGLFPDNNNVACTENTIRHLEQILAFIQLMKHAVYRRKIIPSSFFASYTPLDTHRLKSVQPSKFTPHVYLYLESYSVDHSHR